MSRHVLLAEFREAVCGEARDGEGWLPAGKHKWQLLSQYLYENGLIWSGAGAWRLFSLFLRKCRRLLVHSKAVWVWWFSYPAWVHNLWGFSKARGWLWNESWFKLKTTLLIITTAWNEDRKGRYPRFAWLWMQVCMEELACQSRPEFRFPGDQKGDYCIQEACLCYSQKWSSKILA